MDARKLETEHATIQSRCLFRVQIPVDDVSNVLEAILNVTPLRYGNYEQVAFRYCAGIQQYRSLDGSKMGRTELIHIPCDEISFTVTKHDEIVTAVIDAIFASHPHEEPVILIEDVMCTKFRYGQ